MDQTAAPGRDNPAPALCLGCMSPDAGARFCPHCGWKRGATAESLLHLEPGSLLHNSYLVGRVLGQGGFGITYLGWDLQLQRKVAIKEYLPQSIASRLPRSTTVAPSTVHQQADFEYGLRSFMSEGKTLARFSEHPCIVSVLSLFEENRTGYLVMGYLTGQTLSQSLSQVGGRISYEAALGVMMRVLDGLREVHAHGLLHRDISPDNIYLTEQGPVKILDFGAARLAVGERSQNLSVILKEGYAPEEQYRRSGNQGPWTDIYAAAATLYRSITGVIPPPALDRLAQDQLVRPSAYCTDLPREVEAAILRGMAVHASERHQSVESFQESLLGGNGQGGSAESGDAAGNHPSPGVPEGGRARHQVSGKPGKTKSWLPAVGIGGGLLALVLIGLGARSLIYSHDQAQGEAAYSRGDYEAARSYFQPAADAGNAAAEMGLGRLFAKGEGARQDYQEARQWYEKAAASGNAEAMVNLGFLYDNGFGVAQDYSQAMSWYRKAADAGNADAMGRIGLLYHEGLGVEKNNEQARQWYEKSSAKGSLRGMTNLGLLYQSGDGVSLDPAHARQLYDKAAAAGSPAGMTLIGQTYENGTGRERDYEQARQWYEKGAAAGDPWAMYLLGNMYGGGRGVTQDTAKQRAWYEKAAIVKVPRAVDPLVNERRVIDGRGTSMCAIGDMYGNGQGVAQDYQEARQWYERATAENNSESMARIGQLHFFGRGVKQDYGQARQWYEKAAGQGNAAAMNDLGVLYANGEGVPQSYERASQWYEKSAAGGNTTAMNNLANLCDAGKGVPLDKAQAHRWRERSANAGDAEAMLVLAGELIREVDLSNTAALAKLEAAQKLQKARLWVQKAAEYGNLKAKAFLPIVDAAIQKLQ